MKLKILLAAVAAIACASAQAQVNSGSNGSDGAFNPVTNIVINMADHPNGIYQYTSVNISNGVTVTFIPNANNTPVTWLVQSNVVINGRWTFRDRLRVRPRQMLLARLVGQVGFAAVTAETAAAEGWALALEADRLQLSGCCGSIWNGSVQYVSYTNGTATYGNQYLVPLLGGSGGGGVGSGKMEILRRWRRRRRRYANCRVPNRLN